MCEAWQAAASPASVSCGAQTPPPFEQEHEQSNVAAAAPTTDFTETPDNENNDNKTTLIKNQTVLALNKLGDGSLDVSEGGVVCECVGVKGGVCVACCVLSCASGYLYTRICTVCVCFSSVW